MKYKSYDLVVVGGGIVGLALASALMSNPLTAGLKLAVIDSSPAQRTPKYDCGDQFDPRVVALSRASQSLLNVSGAWSRIMSTRACPFSRMNVWDAEGTGNIQFDSHAIHEDYLGWIVENSIVTQVLTEVCESFSQLTFFPGTKVVDVTDTDIAEGLSGEVKVLSCINAQGDEAFICAPLVLAADGAHSYIRSLCGFSTREWDYQHHAIVTTVQTELPHEFCAWQRFTPNGPLAFLPLVKKNYCSLVWSIDSSMVDDIMALDDQRFCKRLSEQFEYRLGAVSAAAKRFAIPLKQRHAVSYIASGIALVGDAAHTIHPLAGQGVNLGLQDVAVISDELGRACLREIPLSDLSILKRYERRRMPHNLGTMAAMEGFKWLFGQDDIAIRWLRNAGLHVVNQQAWLKRQMMRVANGKV